jgi:DNA-binding transcriptional LysR family regulator
MMPLSFIDAMNVDHVDHVDLNLLKAFKALHEEGSVSRAALRLGIGQPAMSHALKRLRELFQDPLFHRVPVGIEPTARANEIAQQVQSAFELLSLAVNPQEDFDPSRLARTFVIAGYDYGGLVFLPGLQQRLSEIAPGVVLRFLNLGRSEAVDGLEAGTVDLVIATPGPTSKRLRTARLMSERFVALTRRGHPLVKDPGLRRYLDARHVAIGTETSPTSLIEGRLARLGLNRRIVQFVPHFSMAAWLVAETDLVATLGERLAQIFARFFELTVIDLPFDIPEYILYLYWNRRYDAEPVHRWLRSIILGVLHEAETAFTRLGDGGGAWVSSTTSAYSNDEPHGQDDQAGKLSQ